MSDKIRLIYNKIENRVDEICDDGFVSKENQQEYETLTDLEDFIDSLPEKPASEDLEDAAYHFCMDEYGNPKESLFEFDQRCFKAGAEWQKNQMKEALQTEYEKGRFDMREEMMKDAVDGEYWDGSIYLDNRPTEYKDGGKMKIIIVKEEQQ